MPYFLLGMFLLIIFATALGWFPTSGMSDVGAAYTPFLDQLLDFGAHLVLPLATVSLGLDRRSTRSSCARRSSRR